LDKLKSSLRFIYKQSKHLAEKSLFAAKNERENFYFPHFQKLAAKFTGENWRLAGEVL